MAIINDEKDLEILREGGKILASILSQAANEIRPGAKGDDIDAFFEKTVLENGGSPSFKNYSPGMNVSAFPASLCLSINDEVVHGIPFGKVLKEGDLVGLDAGVMYKGFFTDMAITVPVGEISEENKRLLDVCKSALQAGIKVTKSGVKTGAVGSAIQDIVEQNGFSVVRTLIGHGVGKAVHEPPEVPNFGLPDEGVELVEGMIIAIEPMINVGGYKIVLNDDGWTWRTKDGSNSAHFEHTVRVTKNGAEIITI